MEDFGFRPFVLEKIGGKSPAAVLILTEFAQAQAYQRGLRVRNEPNQLDRSLTAVF
jgi:hypothetical protein